MSSRSRFRGTMVALAVASSLVSAACSSGRKPGGSPSPTPTPSDWTELGPGGGFFASIAFQPGTNDVWMSGDDGGGLYESVDGGGSFTLLTDVPADQSTYTLTFDPADGSKIYAPNHFGRGMLRSVDGGASWVTGTAGLPAAGDGRRFYSMAVDPNVHSRLYAALAGGLFLSTNSGASFAPLTSATFGGDTDFRSVVARGNRIVTGSSTGRLYTSTNGAASWTQLTTSAFEPISDLALTDHALYVAYPPGYLVETSTFIPSDLHIVNDPTQPGAIQSALWTKLAAVSGASAATDRLYVGTTLGPGATNYGVFVSTNGAASFVKRVAGLTGASGASVFSIAVDPTDADHVVLGSLGAGVFTTTDAGRHWTASTTPPYDNSSLAFEEDPSDPQHLFVSSTAGLDGSGGVYETPDGGATWTLVS